MTDAERQRVLERIQAAVNDHRYVVTPHAEEEMETDRFDVVDVESAILTGIIERVLDDDQRGQRYEVAGTRVT